MDKKEKRRDIAVFANMLKDLMNEPIEGDNLATLDRDLQHFLYGRVAMLVKHNGGKPLGSVADIGTVVGASLGSVMQVFVKDRVDAEKLTKTFETVKENLNIGFDARTPEVPVSTSGTTEEKKEETAAE